MPSTTRKRAKGKERRKARPTALASLDDFESWRELARWGQCKHGCDAFPPAGHPVARFLHSVFDVKSQPGSRPSENLTYLYFRHIAVWNDGADKEMALGILRRMGTNAILMGDGMDKAGWMHTAAYYSTMINLMERYDGTKGVAALNEAILGGGKEGRDIKGGGNRALIRFYAKRVPCLCLGERLEEAKKSQPVRTSLCSGCRETKERSKLRVCGRCKLVQYCSKECQNANWPMHKGLCYQQVPKERK